MELGKADVDSVKLYRRRFIPEETVFLKKDIIVKFSDEIIVTKWSAIKPRPDFSYGCSVYYPGKGWKISKFYDEKMNFIYYYCDIINTEYFRQENEVIFSDLLVDVVVFPDGSIRVLDLDEIPEALDLGLIDVETAKSALRKLHELLAIIYNGEIDCLCRPLNGIFEG